MAEHERATAYGELIKALEAVVGEEHVVAGDAALPAGVDGVTPKVAVFPADAREIGAVVAYANEQRLAVLPIGGGDPTWARSSARAGGYRPIPLPSRQDRRARAG